MSNVSKVQAGEEVHLVAEVQGGDGASVTFRIAAASGDELEQLTAAVAAGVARAVWTADPKKNALPLEVKFFASVGDQSAAGRFSGGRALGDGRHGPAAPVPLPLPGGLEAAAGREGDAGRRARQRHFATGMTCGIAAPAFFRTSRRSWLSGPCSGWP